MARSNKVGELRIEITADTVKLTTGTGRAIAALDRLDRKAKVTGDASDAMWRRIGAGAVRFGAQSAASLARTTAALTAFGVAAGALATGRGLVSLAGAAEQVDAIGKAGARLGVTTEEMSVLRYTAGQAGVAFETLQSMGSKALRTLAKEVEAGKTSLTLGDVKVQLTDVTGRMRGLTELLSDLARGVSSARGEAEQLRLSERIFGRAGADEFVQLLRESGNYLQNLNAQREQAGRLGAIFTQRDFQIARDYGDAIDRVKTAWLGVKVAVLREVGPALTDFTDSLARRLGSFPQLVRATAAVMGVGTTELTAAQRLQASSGIAALREATGDVLKTAASEVGRVIGVTFLEAVSLGLKALAPDISDVFRDALGPVLNAIPGVNIAPSNRTKLAQMVAGQSGEFDRANRLASIQNELDNSPTLEGFQRAALEAERVGLMRAVKSDAAYSRATATQRAIVDQERIERGRMLADAYAESFDATAAALRRARENISASLGRFDQAADGILELYRQISPPTSQGSSGPTMLMQVQRAWDGFVSWGESTISRIRKIAPQLRDALIQAQFVSADLEGRRRTAIGDPGAAEFTLRTQQARELMEYQAKFPMLVEQLRATQQAEIDQLLREQAKEAAKKQEDISADARALRARYLPRFEVQKQRQDFANLAAQRPDIITLEVIGEFRKELFELELQADRTFTGKMTNAVYEWRDNVTDAFVELRRSGEVNFEQLYESFADTLTRMAAQELIVTPLFQGLIGAARGFSFGGNDSLRAPGLAAGAFGTSDFGDGGWVLRAAEGAWVPGPNIPADVVPSLLMPGERVLSHAEVSSMGGVAAVDRAAAGSGGGVTVQVIDQRSAGAPVQVEEGSGPDGQRLLRVLIRDEGARAIREGAWDTPFRGAFGLNRRPGR